MMENFGWQFLPQAGGLLDQDEDIMQDVMTISWRKRYLQEIRREITPETLDLNGVVRRKVYADQPPHEQEQ